MDSFGESPSALKKESTTSALRILAKMKQTAEQLLCEFLRLEKYSIKLSGSSAAMSKILARASGKFFSLSLSN